MKQSKRPSGSPKADNSNERPAGGLPRLNVDEEEQDGNTGSHSEATETNMAVIDVLSETPIEALTMVTGSEEGRIFPINLIDTWIGRADDCAIMISDRGVSRHHACIIHEDARLYVKDNDAKNGTFVNNRRISKIELEPGDEIQLGPNVCLVYSHEKVAHQRARDKVIAARLQHERVESIRSMVAGVAHQINTPLGVATAANALIETLAEEVRTNPDSDRLKELLTDLKASTGLVSKNLERASDLVRTFKKLSYGEAYDERCDCDLADIGQQVVELTQAEARAHEVTVKLGWSDDARFPWVGYQGGMTRILAQLVQNAIVHGYANGGGVVDIRITRRRKDYHVEVEDSGAGMQPGIVARIFEPFVTAVQGNGGTGLGLAIVHNLVTNVLCGGITFTSQLGKGTRFVLKLPLEVPLNTSPAF
jgi:signal transduction histidine kinase